MHSVTEHNTNKRLADMFPGCIPHRFAHYTRQWIENSELTGRLFPWNILRETTRWRGREWYSTVTYLKIQGKFIIFIHRQKLRWSWKNTLGKTQPELPATTGHSTLTDTWNKIKYEEHTMCKLIKNENSSRWSCPWFLLSYYNRACPPDTIFSDYEAETSYVPL